MDQPQADQPNSLAEDDLAEGVRGAVTGTDGVHVTHVLYADDLTLAANDPIVMQTMLNRLDHYAQRKHLRNITAKLEAVHFNLSCSNLPAGSCVFGWRGTIGP
eukprot:1161961-Pelagomonas_calceolata.AAC.7